MKKHVLRLLTGLTVAMFASSAQASVMLRLTDLVGGGSVTITDNLAGDANATNGVVTWIGSLGSWTINVSTGINTAGSLGIASLDLNSVNTSSSGAGGTQSIRIELTESFTAPAGSRGLLGAIGGTTNGSLVARAWLDNTNAAFGHGGTVVNLGTLNGGSGGAFSTSGASGSVVTSGAFSITNEVTITHAASGGATSFDFQTRVVPEPTTLWSAAMGMGLCALALRRRMR
jgi:hypothetical protein